MKAIRGAIFVKEDTYEEIKKATEDLMSEVFSKNSLHDAEVVSVIFSLTKDLTSMNPATVFRKLGHDVPLMCFQEADFANSPKRVLRVLVFVERPKGSETSNVYKNGAEILKNWKW